MIYAGSHISSSKGYAAMGRQIKKLGGDTFAFFTRNPRGGKGVMINELDSDVPEYVNDEIKEMDNVIDSTLLKAI